MTPSSARTRQAIRIASIGARTVAGAVALTRLAGAARAAAPVERSGDASRLESISVVIPARDEAGRIGPLLAKIVGAPGVLEVIVVDDQSSDETARLAASAGATVIPGVALPNGWAGKAWALQQGVEAAVGDWVVTLDADTRPDPLLPAALVARASQDGFDFLTVGGRFECPTPGARWLHASMLTTLVYRFGPPGVSTRPNRAMANGQCMATRRSRFLDAGGLSIVSNHVVEDIALARHLASSGWSVGFLDASELLTVRMFESLSDTWSGWGRSLALPGVDGRARQLIDLVVVLLAQALPLPRVIAGRGDLIDAVLLATRIGTLMGTRTAYDRADVAYWLSPLADVPSALTIAKGISQRSPHVWRGRSYE